MFLDAHIDFYPPSDSPTGQASDSEMYLAFGYGADVIANVDGVRPLVTPRAAALIGHRDSDEWRDTGVALSATDALVVCVDVTIYNPLLDPDGEARRNLTGCLIDAFTARAAS
ncbi:hypothetical protein [Nonomuraea basaltis]|uniref:hypothetical protein n=1 Tax=Nonomuraea basaltis TaxID=2495887 RepID=UPI00110C5AFE|nr:hypothetical protein [Nonomuraea basaltis]TMR95326.1 hypothetical protein EJK15_29115 [Nonomuraea basaltis]